MKKELNRLTNTLVKLHECSKNGKKSTGYKYFKEAMSILMSLEGDGINNAITNSAKEILSEYYNTYSPAIKEDSTRVIVEAKTTDIEKQEEKARKEERKQLKEIYKEMNNNLSHLKESIMEHDWASIDFRANQIKKICERIIAMGSVYLSDTGDESSYLE